ncbi:sulfate adenylyltransferase subunit CysD [Thermomonas sp.]|uniref:sulfate adenylyltransferase subunit CysD n=1 Tax=Thermomonas sp. TaxID=1971895 RepID=UPI00260D5F2E|nr:sulfate adenylyltransferase subunit CysD [Thermomonas sp.]MCO5056189.1 sulfate adenylyltransferase subunit CysD [Thermomonas sp.]
MGRWGILSEVLPVLSHLRALEAESLHILRETAAQFRKPVLLYSIGKDSSVLVHLARKAFHPGRIPFPLLHIDTTYEYPEMIEFRDRFTREIGAELRVYTNQEAIAGGANPYDLGTAKCCGLLRTRALVDGLRQGGYDAALGGARRDEEKSRAKERVFSFRNDHHRWDPKNQRPELWNLYNARIHKGESVRAFPLSNWTELDIWLYIFRERIEVPSLYFARTRPVVERDGALIMVDDARLPLHAGEVPMQKQVRFRTLGCYPLTGAIESEADTLEKIIAEMLVATTSERQGRVIDQDPSASMEKKKQEGYF